MGKTQKMCTCCEVLLALDVREKELNDQIWPRIGARGINWAELKTALEQLARKGLVVKEERRIEGHRLASFYKLTAEGRKKSQELRGEKNHDTATACGEKDCCLTQAA
ncbi:MAG: hypothetical protein AAB725_03060 [Patescibacteria group bacterium]